MMSTGRLAVLSFLDPLALFPAAHAQCPDYSNGNSTAGIGIFNGGDEARLVYIDCLPNIAVIEAKFGHPGLTTPIDGLPLTLAVWDDPTDDQNPNDAVLVAQVTVPAGVTGGHTGLWQTYDLSTLLGNPVPATGGMWIGVGVRYPAGASPASIQFFNHTPNTQWLASAGGPSGVLNYSNLLAQNLYNVANVGFPAGNWIVRARDGGSFTAFGTGCAGSAGVPALAAATPPNLGSTFNLQVSGLNPAGGGGFLMLGFSDTVWNGLPLPWSLGSFGMPGCDAFVSADATLFFVHSAGAATIPLALPSNQAFAGTILFTQAFVLDAAAGNSLGAVVSNAGRATIR